ncbi:uncharacterized protein LOC131521825 isoform X2 [Onychostoma macrolepis]|uniref:Uncharacterized protein n=1 Tax=Onychostoma macrolepis TaxID=369639 RepID=A0A7J6CB65_9TELE|nr:uncharacterized protein LOC131521825 isoform X2 [Onychostoma macrolepis]KAF4103052.1 hypothetical protein G5714_015935 [Onychostoma macrolepis]
MDVKEFGVKILCFISVLSNHSVKGYGSNLKCCFEVLTNLSVSYHLNEPPGAFCTPTWSAMEYVVVDEHGNVDETKVVYLEPQKLILKQTPDEKVITYRKDCQLHAYTASCHDPCNVLDLLRTTPAPQAPVDQRIIYITGGVAIIIIIIIIISVICLRRKCQSSNVTFRWIWKAVPKNESPTDK